MTNKCRDKNKDGPVSWTLIVRNSFYELLSIYIKFYETQEEVSSRI